MAKDGIHALVLVISLRNRLSEEASAFESLLEIFGGEIANYMIVVFSHGDVLEDDVCLNDLLGPNCPPLLLSTLEMCGNRTVVFDNKTGDKVEMRNELVSLVDYVVDSNGGKPYTNDLFGEVKVYARRLSSAALLSLPSTRQHRRSKGVCIFPSSFGF